MKKTSSRTRSQQSRRSSRANAHRELAHSHAGLRFVRRFQNALARGKILPRGSKIVVAVSGGPDSLALLHLLARLEKKHGFRLHVAHVNYRLRGRDSDRDEHLVRATARQLDVPLSVWRSSARPRKNIEETLRTLRYPFFEKVRKRQCFDFIVTAHTQNDLAETFLMNLLRGSGLRGLSPFQRPLSRRIVRPLIDFTKEDILNFLKSEKIHFRIDRSNRSKRFTRNRIRHELMPLLERFNPSIVATLAATARRLGRTREA